MRCDTFQTIVWFICWDALNIVAFNIHATTLWHIHWECTPFSVLLFIIETLDIRSFEKLLNVEF